MGEIADQRSETITAEIGGQRDGRGFGTVRQGEVDEHVVVPHGQFVRRRFDLHFTGGFRSDRITGDFGESCVGLDRRPSGIMERVHVDVGEFIHPDGRCAAIGVLEKQQVARHGPAGEIGVGRHRGIEEEPGAVQGVVEFPLLDGEIEGLFPGLVVGHEHEILIARRPVAKEIDVGAGRDGRDDVVVQHVVPVGFTIIRAIIVDDIGRIVGMVVDFPAFGRIPRADFAGFHGLDLDLVLGYAFVDQSGDQIRLERIDG